MNKKIYFLISFIILCLIFNLNAQKKTGKKATFNWGAGGPQYVQYLTITGKTGFITTPTAYCAPMGTLAFGWELTASTRAPYGVMAIVNKITFTPHHIFEFGFSKALGFADTPSPYFYFDSTPFFGHMKLRFLDWGDGALAFGLDVDFIPDNSGGPSRGYMSITPYIVFTGITTIIGSFNFGFGKTFYFTRIPDAYLNFFVSYVYSFAKLDHRLQLVFDISNADYQAGDDNFKIATEYRAYVNFQVRGVVVKTPRFQWTMALTLYDIFDLPGTVLAINLNAGFSMNFHIDLY